MKDALEKAIGVDDECLSFCRAFTKAERDLARIYLQTLHQAIKDCPGATSIVIARQFRELLRSGPYEALLQTAIQAILRQDDLTETGSLSMSVVPSVNPRAEPEGHHTSEAPVGDAPLARGQLSVPSAEGDGAGDDQSGLVAQAFRVSPAPSKSLPAPVREPDERERQSRKNVRLALTRANSGVYIHDSRGHARLFDDVLRASLPGIRSTKGRETIRNMVEYNTMTQADIEAGIAQPGQTMADCLGVDRLKRIQADSYYTTTARFFIAPESVVVPKLLARDKGKATT
jgi:hypothetical protein